MACFKNLDHNQDMGGCRFGLGVDIYEEMFEV